MSDHSVQKIAVFCGSQTGNNPIYQEAAEGFANILVANDITMIYGGAQIGIMGKLANTMLAKGGKVTGVIPRSLVHHEIAHENLEDLRVVNSMHERKALIAELADAFVMLPGGIGSLDEFFEIWTWAQLGFHYKPIAVLNTAHYFDHLFKFLNHVVDQEFMSPLQRSRVMTASEPEDILLMLTEAELITDSKWHELFTDKKDYAETQ